MKNYTVNNYALDTYQSKLIDCNNNAIVIAGAGSGKTLTILGKVHYLIEHNVNPQDILVISFTNASTLDIKQKLKEDVQIYTFHKLAVTLLKKANYPFSITSSSLLNYVIQECIKTCTKDMQKNILKFLNLPMSFMQFCNSDYFYSFANLIQTFINLWKTNAYISQNLPLKKYTPLERKILYFIFSIYQTYINEKESTQTLDFDDLIFKATNIVKNLNLTYKYIIIDEFQDTSYLRLNLIKEIYNVTSAKVIVVGDDYQSIYRFSGCDLHTLLNFKNIFPHVEEIKLVNTYRNSQELINIASRFILKNPAQIKKELVSSKNEKTPFILVPYQDKVKTLKQVINSILPTTSDIMILSRNNKDIYSYIDNDFTISLNQILYKNYTFKYYTVHKSKGLEANTVIVLNCNDEKLGFPNQIEDNIILKKLYPEKEIKYAEERRLFYVAITRSQEKTYLLYDKDKPSSFIKEIKKIIKKQLKHVTYFKN